MLGHDRLVARDRRVRARRDLQRQPRSLDRLRHRAMTAPTPLRTSAPGSPSAAGGRRGRLALALQEPLTTIARLRSNKQVATDAESFRVRITQVLSSAE